jgi:hypothetical protein
MLVFSIILKLKYSLVGGTVLFHDEIARFSGVYMPAFGAMGSCLLLGALSLWCSSCLRMQLLQAEQPASDQRDEKESSETQSKEKLTETREQTNAAIPDASSTPMTDVSWS